MKPISRQAQSGFALILFVLALMGAGGVVLAGFTQSARQDAVHERYLHNQRVLREAKQALLQYAYNYPQMGTGQNDGPGRLPCPDIDNDGFEEFNVDCEILGVPMVGRFPWQETDLNFYEAKDASGETLWYAVSSEFVRGLGSRINSSNNGTIAIQDRSGALLHAATFPALQTKSGVAAVIIAPGAPISRDGAVQNRDTAANRNDPDNYLDKLSAAVDNAVFVNADINIPPNGFVTGPIQNRTDGSLLVNDEMIVVTAAEVVAMAEKATLQAYRDAILDYLGQTGGVYPWLYNYVDIATIAELENKYPARTMPNFAGVERPTYLGNYGRVPSIFARYFTLDQSEPLESVLSGTLVIESGTPGLAVSRTGGTATDLVFSPGTQTFALPILPVVLDDIRFENPAGMTGRLTATAAAQSVTHEIFFWDWANAAATGIWSVCLGTGNVVNDCNIPPGGEKEILRIELTIDFPANFTIDADYSTLPATVVTPATATSHATITGSIAGSALDFTEVTAPTITATYQLDRNYREEDGDVGGEGFIIQESGDLTLNDLLVGATLTLEMRYYPELPAWAIDNNWHNSIRMAYADNYLPTLAIPCEPLPIPPASNDCLSLPEEQGARRDIASLLVIAGEHDWLDDDGDGLDDELRDVFDNGNHNNNNSFYNKRVISPLNTDRGNDQVLIINEL